MESCLVSLSRFLSQIHQYVLTFAWTTDFCKVVEDHRNIAVDDLAISQKAFNIQQKEHDWKLSTQ
jgi:ribonuclease I